MVTVQAARGTKDILPEDVGYWQHIEAIARSTFHRAAYQEIRTPIFEPTHLFERGIGEATDVVGKEMYTFTDRGDRSLTLRPENTAGVARALIEHNLQAQGGVQRLWYSGPMFRYERPKAGRQRQFHQIGVEVLGSGAARADAEAIAVAMNFLAALGLQTPKLMFNTIGSFEDRKTYREALVDYLTPYKEDLDPDSQDRLTRNPLRILDTKVERTRDIIQDAPTLLQQMSADSIQRFEQVQQLLTDLGLAYTIDPQLVRGLDYYTHTVFEIQAEELGTEATVCAGGRYDGLVAQLGGADVPAVGWASGVERLLLLVKEHGTVAAQTVDFYVVSRGDRAEANALTLSQKLRQLGFAVELDLSGSAFGKQFKRADRSGAAACFILGDAEAEQGTVQLKWLASGDQEEVKQEELEAIAPTLRQKLGS
ncbi:MAG: histidine--tRNA ligase [Leptolyngbyaceae cyanobacterium]